MKSNKPFTKPQAPESKAPVWESRTLPAKRQGNLEAANIE